MLYLPPDVEVRRVAGSRLFECVGDQPLLMVRRKRLGSLHFAEDVEFHLDCSLLAGVRQSTAMGLTGEPVPFSTRSGATVRRKSQRFSPAQASSSSTSARLSRRCSPIETSPHMCTGIGQSSIGA